MTFTRSIYLRYLKRQIKLNITLYKFIKLKTNIVPKIYINHTQY
jgi:hypothetical protein